MKNLFLSIVISAYNEQKNIERGILNEMNDYLKDQKYQWEVIITDDGSSDNTYNLIKEFTDLHPQFKLIKGDHGGKASGLYHGIKQAQGNIILITDIDQSTPLSELEKILPYFDQGYNVVIGSRGSERANFSWIRKLASVLFRIFRQILVLHTIADTQCGFKAFRAELLKKIFPKLDVLQHSASGWTVSAFDVELLFMAQKAGYKIKEVRVKWQDEDISDTKDRGKKFVKESIDMLKQILMVRLNWLKGKYKIKSQVSLRR